MRKLVVKNTVTLDGVFDKQEEWLMQSWEDPEKDLVGILMTQRMNDSPEPPPVSGDFWTAAYRLASD